MADHLKALPSKQFSALLFLVVFGTIRSRTRSKPCRLANLQLQNSGWRCGGRIAARVTAVESVVAANN
jgi:hypothetical protein